MKASKWEDILCESKLLHILIDLRKKIHRDPEVGLQQPKTIKKIKDFLFEYLPKCAQSDNFKIKEIEQSGLIIDVWGQSDAKATDIPEGKGIAFRAELDALKIKERTDLVDYFSTSSYSHMCGHDGHTVSLVWFLTVVFNNAHLFSKVAELFEFIFRKTLFDLFSNRPRKQ